SARDIVNSFEQQVRVDEGVFSERLQRGSDRALARVSALTEKWRQIHWSTLRACCRAGGRFDGSSGYFDLSSDVARPLLEAITLSWTDFFGVRLSGLVYNAAGHL